MLAKLIVFFIVFGLLLLLRIHLAIVVFVSGIIMSLLFGMGLPDIFRSMIRSASSLTTIKLLVLIYFVLILVEVQKEKQSLKYLLSGILGVFRAKWLITSLSPAIIGLLPMPGGALVSAPMVEEVLKEEKISPEVKTFVNYWFRHVWEFFWPLYQGFILTVAVFGIGIKDLMAHQFYFSIVAITMGYILMFFIFPKLPSNDAKKKFSVALKEFLKGGWEILTIIILILGFKVPLLVSLGVVILFSLIFTINSKKYPAILKDAFNYKILLVILSVMIFKGFVQDSPLFPMLGQAVLKHKNLSLFLMIALPFSIGFFTGVNSAFVAIAFPLFIPIVGKNLDMISLLYISGFSGVLLSPLHLCLVLSAEYFGANLLRVLKYVFFPVAVILGLAIIIFG